MKTPSSRRRLTLLALGICPALVAFTAAADVRTMIVTSDPQYPWTERTDDGRDEDPATRDRRSEALIEEQYRSIAAYRAARPDEQIPVFINGDLTAYGHGAERKVMERLYAILGDNVHLGLGNHDYENNIRNGSDGCYNNGCARDSIADLVTHVTRKQGKISFDFSTHLGALSNYYEGSLAYAFEAPGLPRILNAQLNNHPDYAVQFQTAEDPGRTGLQTGYYDITPSMPWLGRLLKDRLTVPPYGGPRDRAYDFAIVHVHDPSQFSRDFEHLVSSYDVAAVFAGHLHKEMGRYYRDAGTVPVFLSGSASQRTYLIAEHDTDEEVLRVYGVHDNDPENKQLIDTVSTRHGE